MKFGNFQRMMMESQMRFFRTYLDEMEETLKKKNSELEQQWKASEKEENSSDYQDYLIDCNDELQRHFGIFYSSFVIAIFSFLEHEFNSICRTLSIRDKFKITLKDISHHGISRAKTFMEKICDLDLPDENLWKELKMISQVRNCLAHSNGEINDENKNLLNYVKKSGKIKIEEHCTTETKTIKITKEYCSFAIETIEEYLLTLIDKNTKSSWEKQ